MQMVLKKLIHEGKLYRVGELIELSKTEAKNMAKQGLVEEFIEPTDSSRTGKSEQGESAEADSKHQTEEA